MFLANNWGLLSLLVSIAVATTWPRISEWLLNQKATLGPTFYNQVVPLIALVVYAMMGVAPLLGWRKTSPELFRKGFVWPVGAMVVTAVLHLAAQVAVTTSVSDPRADFDINALGTFNVLEAVRTAGQGKAAVLYSSTNKVYGGLEHVGMGDRDILQCD